jgi:NAD(P)-dependent dehydrogenase (short-subunit alcohol dehydrogenase family)
VLANLPNAAEVCREIFGKRLGIVPYIMPGFALAKKAAEIYDKNPEVEGLLLVQHGHFTFGETARTSYEKIIEHTNEVAKYLGMETATQLGERCMARGVDLLPTLRGLIAEVNSDRDKAMPIFDLRNGDYTQEFLARCDVEDLSTRGMASPDHVLRTKGSPLLLTSAEQNLRVRAIGEDKGGFFPLNEKDMFDCEYWSLEQAKLGKGATPPFEGQIVMITGGAGAIGLATAKAFAAKGANIVLVDLEAEALDNALKELGPWHASYAANITSAGAAEAAMRAAVLRFGGLDILISNAGSATGGAMLEISDEAFRKAFELNFFAHKNFATEAARLMKTQGRGGQILFNISKQAINPGKNMGAYGTPKAATLFLMRQLTLELAGSGIRVNGMNADRIRSGLLTDDFIKERAAARGLTEEAYMGGNLLGREVEARHVADGFVNLALMERTTGHVITVDGGNTEAELR